ncbi:phosphoenolpyruvate synthase [Chitinophaga terrae (ex Kim and Jung 2007)]|uniref:Phosphoenolpyruvate synthase n=1 Tax=Chitinophaga terrae (ex Kim and Jung 2007) TaxID=408074 RepID=A0A1H4GPV0_9BACT|nr:phosphoenolpyruvate synthase [Chitinophaga terrae (ex Kim and Jung 2007)]GEP93597.1 phosphoenolpyruvate synthase [Chitinophaga terrae (ex Kim and Jung 2007)]SEB10652.1 phosphoenolpyruvate synthase [Chitinophaga terrae (ex Kim and Jung 2007)]
MSSMIKPFSDIHMTDVQQVGGKNASLGEMINTLSSGGIQVPDGFAVTASAFWDYLAFNNIRNPLSELLQKLDRDNFSNLHEIGDAARKLVLNGIIPDHLKTAITGAYNRLTKEKNLPVAVRSSATAEDMPNASFAGQHESFLNISGEEPLLLAVRKCFASLYTDRAIKYREDNGFEHMKVALSVGIQLMVDTSNSCSGVGFTLEPESGFRDIVLISGVWGLGENIVQGIVMPDEFYVFKPTLSNGKQAIIQKKLGTKEKTLCFSDDPKSIETTVNKDTSAANRERFVLENMEITKLAQWAVIIEQHYNCAMDIEWAKDGNSGELYILQARPETIHTQNKSIRNKSYKLTEKGVCLTKGEAIGEKIAVGTARILRSPAEAGMLKPGDIVVTTITSPDWDPVLKKVGAIVTDSGGRTSHASIVARELGVPAIVGTGNATASIQDGMLITVSCCEGKTGNIYKGALKYECADLDFNNISLPESTAACLIMSDPDKAFQLSFYPNNGVGLLRMEFIITHTIRIHPMALISYDELADQTTKEAIATITNGYTDKRNYFIDKLSQSLATIAAAFYPKDVIVRMSDFKTNEYAQLLGGKEFEPSEENPMLGFRGASRYYHPMYKEGFGLECAAIKIVREQMGLTNVKIMIPFCRTAIEAKKVLKVMEEFGLSQKVDGLQVYAMAEIPSNVLEAAAFAEIFDGFSIGSNDLTQLTLGIDRDSVLLSEDFNEEDPAAKKMIGMMIEAAQKAGVPIGLCGQAPSDLPDFAAFLVEKGINSISFNPDAILRGINNIRKAEEQIRMVNNGALPVLI